jgi:presenilin-like A22 family membrane protease
MNEASVGIIVLVSISIIVSVVTHYFSKRYVFALIVSAILASILFQIAAFIHIGYLDPFFIIAFFIGGLIAFGISAIIGIPFKVARKRQK